MHVFLLSIVARIWISMNSEILVRVKTALSIYKDDFEIITFEDTTATAELAAKALGVAVGQIAKSLCFVGDQNPFLVVTVGDRKIDAKKLAKDLGYKKVKFADADTVKEATGFSPGGVCPFALNTDMDIYLDESLFLYDIVYAAAGTANSALPIAPARLKEITGANIVAASIE